MRSLNGFTNFNIRNIWLLLACVLNVLYRLVKRCVKDRGREFSNKGECSQINGGPEGNSPQVIARAACKGVKGSWNVCTHRWITSSAKPWRSHKRFPGNPLVLTDLHGADGNGSAADFYRRTPRRGPMGTEARASLAASFVGINQTRTDGSVKHAIGIQVSSVFRIDATSRRFHVPYDCCQGAGVGSPYYRGSVWSHLGRICSAGFRNWSTSCIIDIRTIARSPVLIVTENSNKLAIWMCILEFTVMKSRSPVLIVTKSSIAYPLWMCILEFTRVKGRSSVLFVTRRYHEVSDWIHILNSHWWKAVCLSWVWQEVHSKVANWKCILWQFTMVILTWVRRSHMIHR